MEQEVFLHAFEANHCRLCHLSPFVVIWLEIVCTLLKRAGEEQIADFSNIICISRGDNFLTYST